MKEIKQTVIRNLKKDKLAQCNDIYLTYLVLRDLGLPTDLAEWDKFDSNVLESIRRCRQKAQSEFPGLRNETTRKRRFDREEVFLKLARKNGR